MQLSDLQLKAFLCLLLVGCYLYLQNLEILLPPWKVFYLQNLDVQMFKQFDKQKITVSNSSFTSKFHFFSAFSTGPGKVTILVLAHNSIEVE